MKFEIIHVGSSWYVCEDRLSRFERLKTPGAAFSPAVPVGFDSEEGARTFLAWLESGGTAPQIQERA